MHAAGTFLSSSSDRLFLEGRPQKPNRMLIRGLFCLKPSHSSCPPVAGLKDCATKPAANSIALFQGDYIWIEPVSRREFDVAIGARVVTAEGRRIQVGAIHFFLSKRLEIMTEKMHGLY